MRQRTYLTEGIVLGRKIFGEADRTLAVFSKHLGKINLIAKGVRKPKSRKRGHIEVFSRLKFSAVKRPGLDIITEAEVVDSFTQVRKDLKKVALAYYFVEVVGKITKEEEKNEGLYLLLCKYLEKLNEGKPGLKTMREEFVREVLVTLGYWPQGRATTQVDKLLEDVIERKIHTLRVGKQMLQ